MNKIGGMQFMLYGGAATVTVLLFANNDRGGGDFNPFLQYLTTYYLVFYFSLFFFVV